MGTFQQELADRSGTTQSALSRVMPMVWGGIISLSNRYIRFPSTAAEQANFRMHLTAMSSFLNVFGAIDYTRMSIWNPCAN